MTNIFFYTLFYTEARHYFHENFAPSDLIFWRGASLVLPCGRFACCLSISRSERERGNQSTGRAIMVSEPIENIGKSRNARKWKTWSNWTKSSQVAKKCWGWTQKSCWANSIIPIDRVERTQSFCGKHVPCRGRLIQTSDPGKTCAISGKTWALTRKTRDRTWFFEKTRAYRNFLTTHETFYRNSFINHI